MSKFLSKNDCNFIAFQNTMDSVYRKLRQDGVGAKKKHAKPFSKEEENQLWESGTLGVDDPVSLQRAVFYYNGKNFCLSGGFEHIDLKISQLKRGKTGYTYTEHASKNCAGGIRQLRLDNKSVYIAAVPEAGECCHCSLLDKYISMLPPNAVDTDTFYVRPLSKPTGSKWYSSVPIGRNKFSKMVMDMCQDSGIEPQTNHSLRATGVTSLFNSGVPKKLIKDISGHLSDEALQMYERPSQHAVARVLASRDETSFQAQMNQLSVSSTSNQQQTSYSTSCPVMNFHNCQVNITYNQGNVSGSVSSNHH